MNVNQVGAPSSQSYSVQKQAINTYQELLKAIKERLSDAEERVQLALSNEELFKKLITTNEELEEICRQIPKHATSLYFVRGQVLEQQKDWKGAFTYYSKASNNGFMRAQTNLGNCYLLGKGTETDKKEATRWFFEAAKQGHARAQFNLAMMLEKGEGIPKDMDGAKYWYKLAEGQGIEKAKEKLASLQKQFDVGEEYLSQGYRHEKEENYSEAFRAYQAAANRGHIGARDKIAIYYLQGKGINPNKLLAYENFLEAAKQGFVRSMFNLAVMLELGDGIPVNLNEARYWYQQAEIGGNKQAKDRLSLLDNPRQPIVEKKDTPQLEVNESTYLNEETAQVWQVDPIYQPRLIGREAYRLISAGEIDMEKVVSYYQHHPVPGYTIGKVEIIYTPYMESAFASRLVMLEQRTNNPAFKPNLDKETNPAWRRKILKTFKQISKPYRDTNFPHVRLIPCWHGTDEKILDSIFRTGYANLATTDSGYYGKGIYSAYEAEYSYRVFSKGALVLNWVATFSPLPVIDGDLPLLNGKGVYSNFDAHIAPVVPLNPKNANEKVYYPCKQDELHKYIEIVVFESAACLPRYLVQLQPILVKSPSITPLETRKSKGKIIPEKKDKHKSDGSKK